MKFEKLIRIKDFIQTPRLTTRDVANVIFDKIDSTHPVTIEMDFDSITFISRSFADEFHKNKLAFVKERDIEVIVVNCPENVLATFKEVAATNKPDFKRTYRKAFFKVAHIRTSSDWDKFEFSF